MGAADGEPMAVGVHRARRRLGAAALAGVLVLTACDEGSDVDDAGDGEVADDPVGGTDADDDATGQDDPGPDESDEPADDATEDPGADASDAAGSDHAVPDTRAGAQLAWILEVVQPGASRPTPGQIADRIAPPLEGIVTPGQLLAAFEDLAGDGPWELRDASDGETQVTAELVNTAGDREVMLNLSVGDDDRMIGLLIAEGDEGLPDGIGGSSDTDDA